MARESQYGGYTIRAKSNQNRQGSWVPQAEIITNDSSGTLKQSLSSTQEYATQAEADDRALILAQQWIDNKRAAARPHDVT